MVSDKQAANHINPMLGSSLIASSVYQKWHTWNAQFATTFTKDFFLHHAHLKFEHRSNITHPQFLQSSALPAKTLHMQLS